MFDDAPLIGEPTTVKVVLHDVGIREHAFAPPEPNRTPMQRTQDEVLDNAEVDAVIAQEATTRALAWMEVITTLPKELRDNLPVLLNKLTERIAEERRLRQ